MHLTSKLPHVGTTIFTVMSGLANEYNAINLSQGFPNFDCSEELIGLVNQSMLRGFNQYAPMMGIMSLRERIAEKIEFLYEKNISPEDEITITSGGTEAIYAAIAAVVREGDEAIIVEPCYDSYIPAILLNKGTIRRVQTAPPHYKIDWKEVRKLISSNTRLIIINSPQNPTGSILKKEDMKQLIDIVKDTSIFILSDEVYEHLIFDAPHESVLKYEALWERSFAVYSFGKTFHATGWKIGYCVAPAPLSKEFRKVHQFINFSTFTPAQYAIAEYMKEPNNYLHLPNFYKQKRDKFQSLMQQTPFKLLSCQGTYFQTASYGHLSQERDVDLAIRLTKEYGVASIPMSAFYADGRDDKVLRFCFAKTDETLEKACELLSKVKF